MGGDGLTAYDAVVLTGGRGARLGGVVKPALVVGGRPIGEQVLAAVAGAGLRVVVGDPVPGADVVTREEPAGGGPVAGLAAGLAHVRAPAVAVLGGDLPFVTPAAVRTLRAALGDGAVALLVDDAGRDQFLCAVWSTAALRAALASVGGPAGAGAGSGAGSVGGPAGAGARSGGGSVGGPAGVPLRAVLAAAGGPVRRVPAPPGAPPAWFDCDTEQDLAIAREWAGG